MHPYFTRLQVKPEVQEFFSRHFSTDVMGNLVFPYGDAAEHFGFSFHKIPVSEQFWMAGNDNFSLIRQVFICSSAMEAVACLNKNYHSFSDTHNLLFLSAGARLFDGHIRWINEQLPGKEFRLVFGRDILGRTADLKVAARLRGWPVDIFYDNEQVSVNFRSQTFVFSQEKFSLNTFEKFARYRFQIPADKANGFESFFDELKANAGFTL